MKIVTVKANGDDLEIKYPKGTLVIPKSCTEIASYAHKNNKKIDNVIFHNKIESIGDYAFEGCTRIKRLDLKCLNLKEVGKNIFGKSLSHLEDVIGDVTLLSDNYIDGVLYDEATTTLLLYPKTKEDKEYTLPSTVKTIISGAFLGNHFIEKVVCNEGLEKICASAFAYAFNLKEVLLPNTIVEIKDCAFKETSIHSIFFPKSIKKIGRSLFDLDRDFKVGNEDTNLSTVVYDGTEEEWNNMIFNDLRGDVDYCLVDYVFNGDNKKENIKNTVNVEDLSNGKTIPGYVVSNIIELFGRKFAFVAKKGFAKGVCIIHQGKYILIDEDLVESESNYIYFTEFLDSVAGIDDLIVASPTDLGFYIDYVKESFDIIDEKLNLGLEEVDRDELLKIFVKELEKSELN